jgi:hypothetical protein
MTQADLTTTPTTSSATDLDAFLGRYLELWNEGDPVRRRAAVEELWRPDAANYTPTIEAVGHDQVFDRVTRSYEAFVGTGQHRFRLHRPHDAHHGAVRVWWEMVTVGEDEQVVATGHEFLVLDDEGRIATDHQFLVPQPA